MTETSAAAYMASNCSFAPTGPVEAFGEGVVDGEADIGGVWLGLLHDPEIAALPG